MYPIESILTSGFTEKKFVIKKIRYKKVHFVYDNSHTLLRIMLYNK
jgi:hypothetical protein